MNGIMNCKSILLGSLFDGIGAVPLAGSYFGIKPVWASEILPNAVSITKRHFPGMAHLGDITELDGKTVEPTDIIAFGSPCQSFPSPEPVQALRGNPAYLQKPYGLSGK
jgi:DNA (cytosine-5)-methyltransferase 1